MKLPALIGVAAAVYAGAGVFLWAAQERMVFHPRAVSGEKRREFRPLQIEFPMPDGVVLRGWLRPPDAEPPDAAPCKLVVYFGGNAEEVSANLHNPPPARAAQLFVNYRGFGDSDGKPSAQNFENDALVLFDSAAERLKIPPEKICVFGRSLGTHMAAAVAARRPVARAVMISPFDSVLNIARARYPIFPIRAMLRHPFVTARHAPKVAAPTLFILAESDWVVPRKRSDELIKLWNAPSRTVVIPGSTHNTFDSPEYRAAVSEFLNSESLNSEFLNGGAQAE